MKEYRLHQLVEWLKDEDLSACFLTSTPNVFYISGFYTNPHERLLGLLAFPNSKPAIVCPNMEVTQVKKSGWKFDIVGYDDTDDPWQKVQEYITRLGLSIDKIAVEQEHMSIARLHKLQGIFPDASLASAEDKMFQLRLIKDEEEISILREAAKLADFGVEVGVHHLKNGVTEQELVAVIEYELKKKGISQMSFSTMALTGEKTAAPHGKPGLDTVKDGDLVLFDLGVVLNGYCSDITRTVAFGNVNEKQQEIYETVLKAQLAAVEACKPGVEIGQIDRTARSVITDHGYGEFFTHRIGHGLGIEVHEYPSMNATNTMTLQKGMTFTIEPGIYKPGVGGVRIEDDILVTESGIELLTSYPKDLKIIKA
ncbi:M24 family metallopeptidase [Sutcliffiella rhizosphaerae]|uniref:Peptidase n=1 Tax=Sutcliffiella rhizosphaerae TaxID=2880967 RepID=A0ABM8YIE0_9BACI|nr:Xaa-Pro peptidase family protein [Sutcliffiella rhizosphaerae]CAG9619627.1 putative peptidase [Sutcliffiella rhizosphaerae]